MRVSTRLVALIIASVALTTGVILYCAGGRAASAWDSAATSQVEPDEQSRARLSEAYGKLPLSFEANEGQSDQRVKFISRGRGYSLFLTADEALLVLTRTKEKTDSKESASPDAPRTADSAAASYHVLGMRLVGANRSPKVEGLDELPGKINYLTGNDPGQWRTNLSTYAKVHYTDVYPGVDMVYYGNQRQLEYDFVVAPGADPRVIKLQFTGADQLKLNDRGDLLIKLAGDEVKLHKPVLYQVAAGGRRQEVAGRYSIKSGGVVVFEVEKFDPHKTLVIDPVLDYSTQLGSGGSEYATAIAIDAAGNAYITGEVQSGNFPTTPGTLKPSNATSGVEAFVTKLDPTGTSLVYSTFLGGNGWDRGRGIAVDSSGNAYVTGQTQSPDFPTVNAIRGTSGNLLKSSDSGANWSGKTIATLAVRVNILAVDPTTPSTIYAGTGFGSGSGIYKSTDGGNSWSALNNGLANSSCTALVIDPKTPSTLYAAFTPLNADGSGGIYKSTDSGNSWSKINSALSTNVTALAIDPQTPTTLYAGVTFGTLYKSTNGGVSWNASANGLNNSLLSAIVVDPQTPSTVYASAGGGGVFKTTNGAGSWSQVNTGLGNTTVRRLAIDPLSPATLYAGTAGGGVYKSSNGAGNWTAINNGLASNINVSSLALSPTSPATIYLGTSDGRIFKTTNGGNNWGKVYETLSKTDFNALAVDPVTPSVVYAGSYTSPFDSLRDYEAFVSKLNPSGSALIYSTYLGGFGDDFGSSIALDAGGSAYVAGETASDSFPVASAYQAVLKGAKDAFVTKFDQAGALVYSTYLGGTGQEGANGIAVDTTGNAYVTGGTGSNDFPAVNPIPGATGGIFVSKLNQAGTQLVYSTRLGPGTGYSIAVDTAGSAYVTGNTSTGFPTTPGALQTTSGGFFSDAFAAKLTTDGSALAYSTYLGGSDEDYGRGIALDSSGSAYVTGFTRSADYPSVAGALRTKSPFFKSTNGGNSWNNINYGLKGATITTLAVDPQTTSTIYAGTWSGVFKSTDGGNNWTPINNGLSNPSIVKIVVDPVTPSNLYVAASNVSNASGIYKSTNGGNSWSLMNNGLTNTAVQSLAIDPVTPTTLYTGTYGGRVYKTVNGAQTWTPSSSASPSFVVSIAVDPITPTNVYAAADSSGGGIFKSTDGGETFQRVDGLQPNPAGFYAKSVAINPANPSIVYAGMNAGLLKSTDGGASWSVIKDQGQNIVIDPITPSTLYITVGSGTLLKSTDSGQSWKPINKGLTYPYVRALAVNPANPTILYSGVHVFPGDNDVFVTKLNANGSAAIYSTLLGGSPPANDSSAVNDEGYGIAVDSTGHAYVTGQTRSLDFPTTPDAFQPFNIGFAGAFITKLAISYAIGGQVVDGNGTPLSGVNVTLSGAQSDSVITGSDGTYSFANLREGQSYTVSAAKAHYDFTPPSQTFNNLDGNKTANFSAATTNAPFYTISGRITEGSSPLVEANVALSGSQTELVKTDLNGNYSFTVPGGGNYTVTPSSAGFDLSPPSQSFNNLSADQTADFSASRQSLVVTNTSDHNAGSLRRAILTANDRPGPDTIIFNIPGTGPQTINIQVALPEITDPVTIDGTTQPGYAGTPLIEINGGGGNFSGLVISAGNSTVRGLAINRFGNIGIYLTTHGGNVIEGNYIGTDPTGTLPRGNNRGVGIGADSPNNRIGGTTPQARNVISGNSWEALTISSSGNQVQGNYIGTNAAGTARLNNTSGLTISAPNNVIGGTASGAGNLISGNNSYGISNSGNGTLIQGNFIGTDVTGKATLGNTGAGVYSSELATDVVIGGTVAGARNIISGNQSGGLFFGGTSSKVQGNFIGTDVTGTAPLGNISVGVQATNGGLIGGTEPGAGNLISCNGSNTSNGGAVAYGNVYLYGFSNVGATVQGNLVGTDVTGTVALGNPAIGILISTQNNLVGGTSAQARNVISGNTIGIQISGYATGALSGNVVQGNFIGTDVTGNVPLPNSSTGISITDTSGNTIGGTASGAGNLIAFNGGEGIAVKPSFNPATGNAVRGNSIFSNGRLGIDLNADRVTANDTLDADTGANNLQNFPVLTSVTTGGGTTTIQGTLNSTASSTFAIEFFSSLAYDDSGYGEGAVVMGTTQVTTDASGNASFNANFTGELPSGRVVTATATDQSGNTSEFSAYYGSASPGTIHFSAASYPVYEDIGNALVTIVRTGGSTGSITVNYATSDATASAGSDYTATTGTLTFGDGETSKTIAVPITNDGTTEPDETLTLTLSGATDRELLSYPNPTVLKIFDSSKPLTLSLAGDVTVTEGDTGTRNAVFTVNLSAATSRTVTVGYGTSPSNATKDVDYQSVSGTLTFSPGETTKTINVPVNGDIADEFNESFTVFLNNPSNAELSLFRSTARGTIIDDDAAPTVTVDDVSVAEGNSGQTTAKFTLKLSAPTGKNGMVQVMTANGTATGTATGGNDYTSLGGASLTIPPVFIFFNSGQTTAQVNVQISGDTTHEPDETFFLNLVSSTDIIIGDNQGVGTILNDDSLSISMTNGSLGEGNAGTTNTSVTVSLSNPSSQAVTIDYTTADGAAQAGSDYTAISGKLTFNPGETSKALSVPVIGDILDEDDEIFFINLSNPNPASVSFAVNQAMVLIRDDDEGPAVSINGVSVTEGNAGVASASFTVSLSSASSRALSVAYATADGTAVSGSDYDGANGTLTFNPGETAKMITVFINGDVTVEADETFTVTLSNPVNVVLGTAVGTAAILNDDAAGSLQFSSATYSVNEGAGTATITVTRTLSSSGTVQVNYSTSDGTATAGSDYSATSGTLTFGDGVTSQSFSVPVINNSASEADETLTLTLSSAQGSASLGAPLSALLTITDDDAPSLQFSQANYSVSEGAGFLNISVTRSGDLSAPATVKYATGDSTDVNFRCDPTAAGQPSGIASRKCDYHIAVGKLRFAAGEATKQFSLSLVNDVYVEGPETFTLSLSNAAGTGLGQNTTVPVTILDDDTPGMPNPIDNTSFFVRQLYVDLLSREPDPAGWGGWTNRIDQCGQPGQPPPPCDRVTVGGDGFLRSGEFFDRQFFVLRLYRTGLGRILRYEDVGDLAYVSGFLTAEQLELNKQDLVAEIMARQEFRNRYDAMTDPLAYVTALEQTAGVKVSNEGQLISDLASGAKTRAQVYREISESAEVSNKYLHEAQVVSAYYGFFTRNPDGAYLIYLDRLDRGEITLADLANAFINAQEYRQRFGQ